MELAGKKVIVVGLGLSGIAAVRFLHKRGAQVSVTDIKPEGQLTHALSQLEGLPVDLYLGGHPLERFLNADLIILSPGVPFSSEPVQAAASRGIPVAAEVELASRFLEDRIIGITGSNGKSTTTALTAFILRQARFDSLACGNIGSPLIELVETTSAERILAVELSSFQLETISSFRPHVSCLLNIMPDHMDRYPDMASYKNAKLRLFMNQRSEDHAVVTADETIGAEIRTLTRAAVTEFSREKLLRDGVCVDSGWIVRMQGGEQTRILQAAELGIRGPHNLTNALAATAMALLCGAEPEAIAEGLRKFRPLEHRLEPVAEIDGVLFVNDSKATNVGSAAVALQSFDRPLIVIMGGRDKAGDFTELAPLVARHVKLLALVGEAAPKIAAALSDCTPIELFSSMEEAVRGAWATAESGDVVLLAPGCASFDMYENFEHRGRHFKSIVEGLSNAKD